ncbi:MAG: D-aminoacylase [Kiritimatiellae bacterium]|nr:D-aminoacylase [Kiritimatiellia bacterium]
MDWILRGGRVADGLGGEPVRADVGLAGERIAAVGDLAGAETANEFDAAGLLVCPGFMDVHTHSDAYLLIEPGAPSKIRQGVTTEITGNCGASAAPRRPGYTMPSDWLEQTYPGDWHSVAEYRELLDAQRPAVNSAMLIGHRAIRAAVMGIEPRAATADEIGKMCGWLEQALEEGGAGLSTGLVYAPAMFAQPEEIQALAKVVARRGGIYATHMRSEGGRLLEAIDEALDVARATGVRLQISHLKTAGRANWGKLDAALESIRAAQAEGLSVASDRYPYTASCTDLDVILPEWAAQGGRSAILARLRDPSERAKIRAELAAERDEAYWEGVWVGSTRHPDNARFAGQPIRNAAEAWKLHPLDAALRFMETDELFTGGIFFGMSEDNLWRILAEPWVMIGSDASIRSPTGPLSHDHPHPRAYGTFGRFLRAALDGKTVSVGEAVRKMTSLPAEQFRLTDRGAIRAGAFADVVVLDPATFRDLATYENPHQFCEGISAVWVNGVLTLRGGQETGERGGRYLTA